MEATAVSSFADPSVHVPERSDSQRINLFRSIAERRAANCGSDAARISKALSRKTRPPACPVRSRVSCSPCLTIPPHPAGIKPTFSLDSPVVLLNSRVRLFPTTRTFSCPQLLDESLMKRSDYEKGSSDEDDQEIAASDQDSVLENGSVRIKAGDSYEKDSPVILSCSNEFHGAMEKKPVPTGSIFTDDTDAGGPERRFAPEDDGESRKRPYISLVMAKSSENGYNWRKYGQKLVKGSECPRSYYRCTHPNCPVKKKVEQSDDGEMKVIIYKGAHNHQKPQPPRRRSAVRGSPLTVARNVPEIGDGSGIGAEVDIEVEPLWGDIRSGPEDEKLDDLEGASLTSVMTEISEAMSSIPRGKGLEVFESVQAPELSSALASHGIDEDDVGEEADDNELDYKRRKCENCLLSCAVPEPRVAIQIESETDIIDDGYRWRKYGQKVIKGNPNPRSYYKCTSPGCPVRKHVQRAPDDLRYVITTYEGKHNHYKPALRKDCGAKDGNLSGGGTSPPPPIHSQSSNPNLKSKPKPEVQDLIRSDQKPEFGFSHEFLRSRSLLSTTSGNGMKFGASSMYPGKFLPIWSCGSSGTGLWFEPDPSGQSYGFCSSRLIQFNPFQAQPASKHSHDWA